MDKYDYILDEECTKTLLVIGIPANLHGFKFLKESVKAVVKEPKLLHQMTKLLYPQIGARYGSTGSVVERSIRHAVQTSYVKQGLYGLNEELNFIYYDGSCKPTNGSIIAIVSEIVNKNVNHKVMEEENKKDAVLISLERKEKRLDDYKRELDRLKVDFE